MPVLPKLESHTWMKIAFLSSNLYIMIVGILISTFGLSVIKSVGINLADNACVYSFGAINLLFTIFGCIAFFINNIFIGIELLVVLIIFAYSALVATGLLVVLAFKIPGAFCTYFMAEAVALRE
ncbi:unnamed protein product [Rodentolepis nana]|uniref:MARVEL domain-containing protein n=1 Tax=Rodentolepis nana TaxID=102285 RepID=A0A0R3TRV0_RODNA|nr:unnamed protein product [Rodentolepis nana]